MRMLCGLLEADISYANLNAGLIWIFRLVKGEIDMSNISHFVISISKQRLYLGFYCLRVINILTSWAIYLADRRKAGIIWSSSVAFPLGNKWDWNYYYSPDSKQTRMKNNAMMTQIPMTSRMFQIFLKKVCELFGAKCQDTFLFDAILSNISPVTIVVKTHSTRKMKASWWL